MFHIRQIENLDLPELAPYRTMKRPLAHEVQRIFVAEGIKLVQRLLQSRFAVVSVLLPDRWLPEFEPLLQARPENIPVYVISKRQLLEQLIGFSMYQGVMAVGRIPTTTPLEATLAAGQSPRLFLAADGLTSAENLGVLVRNALAFGVQAMLVGETCASPFLRRAVRNSMGAIFQLPIVESPHLAHALRELRAAGFHCIAAHPHTTHKTLARADFTRDCCIVVGSEGHGLSPGVLAACDETVVIPMAADVDSLNVGSAAAVFLYEANRQRGRM